MGVGDGLPQAGPLPDGGHQLDGSALQVVLDGGDDDRDDHDDQLDGGALQGHRRPGQQDQGGGREGGGGAGGDADLSYLLYFQL